jgi:hypothetical protein
MKIAVSFGVLALSIWAATAGAADAGRFVGPIGVGSPRTSDVRLAKALGIPLQRSFASTRARLVQLGWTPDAISDAGAEAASAPFPRYPEISCGSGMDAICTARFTRRDVAIMVTVDQGKGKLPVVHVDHD